MSVLLMIVALVLSVKLTFLIIRVCGKVLGIILVGIGYLLLAELIVGVIGLAIVCIPVVFIVGIVAIIKAIVAI